MQQRFTFKSKPFSINAATYSDARTKTSEYYAWSAQVFHQMWADSEQQKFKEIREFFDEIKHSVHVELKAIYSKNVFITKAGIISSKTQDLSNTEKLLIDLLFDNRFHTREHPYGAPNCDINDKHITRMISEKTFHEGEPLIEVLISIVPRSF